MIKISYNSKIKLLFISLCIFHLLVTDCAKRLHPEESYSGIRSTAESKRLKDFIDTGVEKEINVRNATPDQIINTAKKYLGVPHCMGGKSTRCMDCSGLLVLVFSGYNIELPHNSEEQARYGKIIISMDDLRKGDLVFFIDSYKTNRFITHSGIYTGNNEFIHTSSSKGVTITSLYDSWWHEKFIFGTRILD